MSPSTTAPSPIPLRELGPAFLAAAFALVLLALVSLDVGALSQADTLLHELMHDGRHLLGVPCH